MSKRLTKKCTRLTKKQKVQAEAEQWVAKWLEYFPLRVIKISVEVNTNAVRAYGKMLGQRLIACCSTNSPNNRAFIYIRENEKNVGSVVLHEMFHVVLEALASGYIREEQVVLGVQRMYEKMESRIFASMYAMRISGKLSND